MARQKTNTVTTRQPRSFLWKQLKIDGWGLFKAVVESLRNLGSINVDAMIENSIAAIQCVKFKEDPRGLAWTLVYQAMTKAILYLLKVREGVGALGYGSQINVDAPTNLDENQLDTLRDSATNVDEVLEKTQVVLDKSFFSHPGSSAFCREVVRCLRGWLTRAGVSEEHADSISWNLPLAFTQQLSRAWLKNQEYLSALEPHNFQTPFTPAEEEELKWADHAAWLQSQADRRLFEEEFGFLSVYVPLRAFVEKAESPSKITRTIQMAEDLLDHWLERGHTTDAIRVVEGDPGEGKSSLARVYAATRFGRDFGGRRWRTVYVPLHHPKLDLGKEIEQAIVEYTRSTVVGLETPLQKDALDPTLLILDGLDELSKAGEVGERVIQAFVNEVIALQKIWNQDSDSAKLLVLFCGRPIAVDSIKASVRSEEAIVNLLPFVVNRDELVEQSSSRLVSLAGAEGLLNEDQRKEWWTKYAKASGRDDGDALYGRVRDNKQLEPLTARPLLNYLVAFLATPDFEMEKLSGDLGSVYHQLLRNIWERRWERSGTVSAVGNITFEDFRAILQKIALTAWHSGNTRSVRASLVDKRLRKEERELLSTLEGAADKGVLRLLLAFFFRRVGQEDSERTYEFTHKSFADFLVALEIVKTVSSLVDDWQSNRERPTWTDQSVLTHWARLFGPVEFEMDVWEFVRLEMAQKDKTELLEAWQPFLGHFLEVVPHQGMPMHNPMSQWGEVGTFKEMSRQALISETAFFSYRASLSGDLLPFQVHEVRNNLEFWAYRWRYVPLWAQAFDLSEASLRGAFLNGANLQKATLEKADLFRANLAGTDLVGANLTGANLQGANLHGTNLRGTNLSDARMTAANVLGGLLQGSNLERTDLHEACLRGADLREADLTGADLTGADLTGADLTGADLTGASAFPESLRTCVGEPLRMPNGKPPTKTWRNPNSTAWCKPKSVSSKK